MELFEVEEKYTLSREDAAKRLRALADSLERHNGIEFVRDGVRTRISVADQVELEIEIEIGDESSLEVELSW